VDQGKCTPLPCYSVIVARSIVFGKLETFMDRRDCNQGMFDCGLRMAGLKEQDFPEVRILLAKYFSYTLEAKEMVATSFPLVSRDVDTKLYNARRHIAITPPAGAYTSQAGGLLFAAFDMPNPGEYWC
jgi:hypothetical protein